MIIFLFLILFSALVQISLSSFLDSFHAWANLPYVVGMLGLFFLPQKMDFIMYSIVAAGLVLDIFSAAPFGAIALSLLVTVILVRAILRRIYSRGGFIFPMVAFLGSLFLWIALRIFTFLFEPGLFELVWHSVSLEQIRFMFAGAAINAFLASFCVFGFFLSKRLRLFHHVTTRL